jgi:type I restriction enzyme R subunit
MSLRNFERSKVLALGKLCEDEHLDLQFKALIDAYIYSGREPIKMRFSSV